MAAFIISVVMPPLMAGKVSAARHTSKCPHTTNVTLSAYDAAGDDKDALLQTFKSCYERLFS